MKGFSLGIFMGVLLVGCAGATFPYSYYGLDAENYGGYLRAKEPSSDIPLSRCKPDDVAKGKCIVMLQEEFYKLKQENMDLQDQLAACQHGVSKITQP